MNEVMRTMKNLVRQVSKRQAVFLVLDNHVGPRDGVWKSSEAFLHDPELTGLPVISDPFDPLFPEHLRSKNSMDGECKADEGLV